MSIGGETSLRLVGGPGQGLRIIAGAHDPGASTSARALWPNRGAHTEARGQTDPCLSFVTHHGRLGGEGIDQQLGSHPALASPAVAPASGWGAWAHGSWPQGFRASGLPSTDRPWAKIRDGGKLARPGGAPPLGPSRPNPAAGCVAWTVRTRECLLGMSRVSAGPRLRILISAQLIGRVARRWLETRPWRAYPRHRAREALPCGDKRTLSLRTVPVVAWGVGEREKGFMRYKIPPACGSRG